MAEKEPKVTNKHTKLLKIVRKEVFIKRTVLYGKEIFRVEIKNEPSINCETKEFASHIMREARIDAAYRIMKKPRKGEIKLKL